ncbi:hypothetical protein Nos7524_1511 [Nostoc sp. PCC 7524]|nr:hypothetical protein Nos7524_1511 [Nostoc sp. PCC 7524]
MLHQLKTDFCQNFTDYINLFNVYFLTNYPRYLSFVNNKNFWILLFIQPITFDLYGNDQRNLISLISG